MEAAGPARGLPARGHRASPERRDCCRFCGADEETEAQRGQLGSRWWGQGSDSGTEPSSLMRTRAGRGSLGVTAPAGGTALAHVASALRPSPGETPRSQPRFTEERRKTCSRSPSKCGAGRAWPRCHPRPGPPGPWGEGPAFGVLGKGRWAPRGVASGLGGRSGAGGGGSPALPPALWGLSILVCTTSGLHLCGARGPAAGPGGPASGGAGRRCSRRASLLSPLAPRRPRFSRRIFSPAALGLLPPTGWPRAPGSWGGVGRGQSGALSRGQGLPPKRPL